jgi:hypothetical protein
MHYIPLALLEKQPLTGFSLRDEGGRALPLITRRKNAAIGAATLAALAQSIVSKELRTAADAGLLPEPFRTMRANAVRVPVALEVELYDLCLLNYVDRGARRSPTDTRPDAASIFASYSDLASLGTLPSAPRDWTWHQSGDGLWAADSTDMSAWKTLLLGNSEFRDLADGLARTFLFCVPVPHRPDDRRIVKYSYHEPIREPILGLWHRAKTTGRMPAGFSRLRKLEDALEGLPVAAFPFDEWLSVGEGTARDTILLRTKLLRAATWRAKRVLFDTPSVGWGGSYHVEVVAPEGIQIRRATLNALGPGEPRPEQRALRGARNLDRAQLYIRDSGVRRTGTAEVALKPCSSTVVRSSALTSIFVVGALVLTLVHLHHIQTESGTLDVAGALLLVIPGVVAVYVARGSEHPMTTNLLYGLRIIATSVGFWAVSGVGLALIGPASGVRLALWVVLILLASLTAAVLVVAWRLAARGRPLEQALTSAVGGA